MPKGKKPSPPAPTLIQYSGTDAAGSVDDSVKRRQSFTTAVSAFAAELRARPKKPMLSLPRLVSARKSTDHLSLANASRSKSCSYLPATADTPLLTLVLANTSFLDTAISESGERLYVIDTKGAQTNICREDPVQGAAHVGAVNWADDADEDRPLGLRSSATIQMSHGRRYYAEEFLRRSKLTSSRLFNIPHYPHTLKWKRSGGNYKLVLSKGKTTIAVLEPAVLAAPPRIQVFEAPYEHDPTRPQLEYRGVPVFLLDYMVATALLIVADKDEWLHVASGYTSAVSAHSAPFRLGGQGSIHRWRVEVQTEPFKLTEFGSRASSPTVSSVIDIRSPKGEVDSDCGADVGCETSSPQLRATRMSHLLTTSPESLSSPGHSFSHSPALSIPITAHPFASESNDNESPVDDFGIRYSPLSSVLPPTLGVSLDDSSPSPSPSPIAGPTSNSVPTRRHARMRTRSVESLAGDETPRQAIKSLLVTPTTRPSTAGAIPRAGSRSFRPLPKTPQVANLVQNALPVPSLPYNATSEVVVVGLVSGPRAVSFSSVAVSHSHSPSPPLAPGGSMAGPSRLELANTSDERPRSIRRIASEATLSAKPSSEISSEPSSHASGSRDGSAEYDREPNHERGHERGRDSSLLKSVHRRSIYKNPLSSSSPPAPSRTNSAPSVPILIPRTAPLRIRNIHTHDTGPRVSTSSSATSSSSSTPYLQTQSQSQSQSQAETHQNQTRSRVLSHAVRPSLYACPPPDDGVHGENGKGEDEFDYTAAAPPAYDSIDFSHPPVKETGFQELG